MSEVVAKPLKRVLISRKLAFVIAIVVAVGMVVVLAWSEYRHNQDKADKTLEENEKIAKQLAETPAGSALDAVLQEQKSEAERNLQTQPPQEAAQIEKELNEELARPVASSGEPAGPSPEELRRIKEEELAMSAYGSEMVALKKGGAAQAVANGFDGLMAGAAPQSAGGQPAIPDSDMALLRDSQRPAAQSHQDRNRSFLSNVVGKQGEVYVESGRNERILHEGSIIPAVVARAINSDLPGQVELRTTRDVFDSVSAKVLVIPRGTRAIGVYSSDINAGQDRVLVTFHRLIFPDGRNVYLGNAQGADREGASGFNDRVNTHFWKTVGSSLLLAAIARVAENGDSTTINIGGSSGTSTNSAGEIMVNTSESMLGKYANMQPTIEIRPGTRVNILVNKDILL